MMRGLNYDIESQGITIQLQKQPGIKAWYKRRAMPTALKSLLYLLHMCAQKTDNYLKYRCMVFHVYKQLEQKGVVLPLPYYWGALGVYIEWNSLKDMIEPHGYTLIVETKQLK